MIKIVLESGRNSGSTIDYKYGCKRTYVEFSKEFNASSWSCDVPSSPEERRMCNVPTRTWRSSTRPTIGTDGVFLLLLKTKGKETKQIRNWIMRIGIIFIRHLGRTGKMETREKLNVITKFY